MPNQRVPFEVLKEGFLFRALLSKYMRLLPAILSLLMISASMSGCVSDLLPFEGEHVGTFDTERLGTGTENLDDMMVKLELLESDNPVKFHDGTTAQDGADHFRFRIVVGDPDDETSPSYECRLASDSPDDCVIIESVEDGIWDVNEIITFQENNANICDSGCLIQMTIMNGDIVTEEEENLQFIAREQIGDSPVSHTFNFWMGQES